MSINPGCIKHGEIIPALTGPRLKESADAMKFRVMIGCADGFKDAIL
jgi:hypothetical protein